MQMKFYIYKNQVNSHIYLFVKSDKIKLSQVSQIFETLHCTCQHENAIKLSTIDTYVWKKRKFLLNSNTEIAIQYPMLAQWIERTFSCCSHF